MRTTVQKRGSAIDGVAISSWPINEVELGAIGDS
jgi:hypothetical protein